MTQVCCCPCGCRDDDARPTDDRTALAMVLERRRKHLTTSEDARKLCDACYWDLVDAANGAFRTDVGVQLHARYVCAAPALGDKRS